MAMSGLVKPKKRLWQDTNLEFFGSDTEKQVSNSGHDDFETAMVSQFHLNSALLKLLNANSTSCSGNKLFRTILYAGVVIDRKLEHFGTWACI